MPHPSIPDTALADALLSLDSRRFAREVGQFVETLPPGERGVLASALVTAVEATGQSFGELVVALGLDSADPSLMSASDILRLFQFARRENPALVYEVLHQLRAHPRVSHLFGAAFVPAWGESDTSHVAHRE